MLCAKILTNNQDSLKCDWYKRFKEKKTCKGFVVMMTKMRPECFANPQTGFYSERGSKGYFKEKRFQRIRVKNKIASIMAIKPSRHTSWFYLESAPPWACLRQPRISHRCLLPIQLMLLFSDVIIMLIR